MATLAALPNELLLHIRDEIIYLPPLFALSLTCSRFNRLCAPAITRLRPIVSQQYSCIRCQDAFRAIRPWPWHRLLLLILTHQVPPSYIRELRIFYTLQEEPKLIPSSYSRPAQEVIDGSQLLYDELILSAVKASPWISLEQKFEHASQISAGNEDATLAILLPLLTSLRWLVPPIYGDLTSDVFRRIVCAYTSATAASHSSPSQPFRPFGGCRPALPFSRLLILETDSMNMQYAWPLPHVPPFLSLPSLRRVILANPRDQHFDGWPADTPRPTCPEVYFDEGSVSLEAVRRFADCWAAPCVIRQRWDSPVHYDIDGPSEPEWDCCRVEGDVRSSDGMLVEGTQRVTLSLEDEGGIHVKDAHWAAWLRCGKMMDWRRVGETFDVTEEDVADYW